MSSLVRELTETYIAPYGKELKTTWVGLAFVSFGILTSGVLKASYGRHYLKNAWLPTVGGKFGWIVQEIFSPLFVVLYFQGYKAPGPRIPSKGFVLLILWLVHYWNRAVYSVLVSPRMTSTRIDTVVMAIVFNIINAGWCGHDLGQANSEPFTLTPQTILGLAIFALGMAINISSDAHLRTLRRQKGKSGDYVLPEWGLFKYIISPNYAGEMIEWTGFAIILGRESGWVFVVWTVCNLAPRARTNLAWYREKFGAKVGNRTGIIPGVY
jgi:3-oxo-5-alpha-steroid 4-dehydrogenase 1